MFWMNPLPDAGFSVLRRHACTSAMSFKEREFIFFAKALMECAF
jgi:hypothetical protein